MIFVNDGPVVAVMCPSAGPTGRYLAFEESLDNLIVPKGSFIARISGSDSMAKGMNATIAALLEAEEPPGKFWFADDDHEFDSDVVMKMLKHPPEARVIQAQTMRKQPPFNLLGFTDMRMMWDEGRKRVVREYKNLMWTQVAGKCGLHPVQAVGRGGLLVDATVFREVPRPWFTLGQIDPEEMLEDVYFSDLLRDAGIGMFMDIGDGQAGPFGTGHICPVSVFPYRYADGSVGVELKWPNGKTLIFPMTEAVYEGRKSPEMSLPTALDRDEVR